MKKICGVLLAVFMLLLSACDNLTQDIRVVARTNPKVKLSGYKSYNWTSVKAVLNDPEGKWQPTELDIASDIKFLIDSELRDREIFSTTGTPDLIVSFFIGVDMAIMELEEDPETKKSILNNLPKAGLVVVLVDYATRYVVWMGVAEGDVHENRTDDHVRARVQYAVKEMFKLFPTD